MLEISMAIMIDHTKGCILFGDTDIIDHLEHELGLEVREYHRDQDFVDELQRIALSHPGYSFVKACLQQR